MHFKCCLDRSDEFSDLPCFALEKDEQVLNDDLVLGELDEAKECGHLTLDIFSTKLTFDAVQKHVVAVMTKLNLYTTAGILPTVHPGSSDAELIANAHGAAGKCAWRAPNEKDVGLLITPEDSKPTSSTASIAAPALYLPKPLVTSLQYSPWHPPVPSRVLRGDLAYLEVVSNDGSKLYITVNKLGFYCNNSSESRFDFSKHSNKKTGKVFSSLYSLLAEFIPSVDVEYREQKAKFEKVPYESYVKAPHHLMASPWLVEPETPRQGLGATQFENMPLTNEKRTWAEKFATVDNLPQTTTEEKLSREHGKLYNFGEFVRAATVGAHMAVTGEIEPMNPEDEETEWVYHHLGIVYNYCTDNGTNLLKSELPERKRAGKEVRGVQFLNRLDLEGLYTAPSVVVDIYGRRVFAQIQIPGTFSFSGGPMSRVIYGAVGDKILFDEHFDSLMQKLGRACFNKPHKIFDSQGNCLYELPVSQHVKGILGADGNCYVTGLNYLFPRDIGFENKISCDGFGEYPGELTPLRIEAIQEWWRSSSKWLQDKDMDSADMERPQHDLQMLERGLEKCKINTDFPQDAEKVPDSGTRKEYYLDGKMLFSLCCAITNHLIPEFINDIITSVLPFPIDGIQLTSLMHARGINMRFLGLIADQLESNIDSELYKILFDIVILEIVARSAKHCANSVMAKLPIEVVPSVMVHYFNCLLGTSTAPVKFELEIDDVTGPFIDRDVFLRLSQSLIREDITKAAEARFRRKMMPDWHGKVHRVALFRNLSLKLGLQWKARDYNFHGGDGSNKKKRKTATPIFTGDDLLNIVPVMKYATIDSQVAEELLQTAAAHMNANEPQKGLDVLAETAHIYHYMYDLVHPKLIHLHGEIAKGHILLEQSMAGLVHLRRAAALEQRLSGYDSYQALVSLANLAKTEHESGNWIGGMMLYKHVFKFYTALLHPKHPAIITALINVGTINQALHLYGRGLQFYSRARAAISDVYGARWPNFVKLNYQMAHAQAAISDYSGALESLSAAYNYQLLDAGAEDYMTLKIMTAIEAFKKAQRGFEVHMETSLQGIENGQFAVTDSGLLKYESAAPGAAATVPGSGGESQDASKDGQDGQWNSILSMLDSAQLQLLAKQAERLRQTKLSLASAATTGAGTGTKKKKRNKKN